MSIAYNALRPEEYGDGCPDRKEPAGAAARSLAASGYQLQTDDGWTTQDPGVLGCPPDAALVVSARDFTGQGSNLQWRRSEKGRP